MQRVQLLNGRAETEQNQLQVDEVSLSLCAVVENHMRRIAGSPFWRIAPGRLWRSLKHKRRKSELHFQEMCIYRRALQSYTSMSSFETGLLLNSKGQPSCIWPFSQIVIKGTQKKRRHMMKSLKLDTVKTQGSPSVIFALVDVQS